MKESSRYIALAFNFWNLTREMISLMKEHGNKVTISQNVLESETDEQCDKKAEDLWKWNDNNNGIPLMFNFYHGLELYMKGLLDLYEIDFSNKGHNLTSLYELILANRGNYTPEILALLKKHIHSATAYNPFFKDNNSTVNEFYEAFKYPENKSGNNKFFYGSIRGGENKTFEIYEEIRKATIDFFNAVVKWKLKKDYYFKYLKD